MSHNMTKPKPVCELAVRQSSGGRILFITAHTHESGEWLAKNAPEYGNFYPGTLERFSTLLVADGYDVEDVARYLFSYNMRGEPETE